MVTMSFVKVCSVPNCGEKFSAKGLCRRHYKVEYRKKLREQNPSKFAKLMWECNSGRRKRSARDKKLANVRTMYGVSRDQYLLLEAERNGMCDICGKTPDILCVDHNHLTGKVRALICSSCNVHVGFHELHGSNHIEQYLKRRDV